MVIARLILRDRRACQRSGQSTRPRTNRGAPPAGSCTTDQRPGRRTSDGAETGSLAGRCFTGGEPDCQENRGRDRWDEIFFHNALDSKCGVKTDVSARYSAKLQQLAPHVQEFCGFAQAILALKNAKAIPFHSPQKRVID